MIKLVSWNVNGLRACVKKGFDEYFKEVEADIFCVQETKLQEGQIVLEQGEEYNQYWNYAVKKGIQAQLYSPKSSRSLRDTEWKRMKKRKAGLLRWSSNIFI